MRITDVIDIAAAPGRVWELTADIESWPRSTPTITRVVRLDEGPLRVGSAARLTQPGQPERVWTVSELDDGLRFAWSTRTMGCVMTARHALAAAGDGTRNTLTLDLEGPVAFLLGAVMALPLRSALRQENRGFKMAAEAV